MWLYVCTLHVGGVCGRLNIIAVSFKKQRKIANPPTHHHHHQHHRTHLISSHLIIIRRVKGIELLQVSEYTWTQLFCARGQLFLVGVGGLYYCNSRIRIIIFVRCKRAKRVLNQKPRESPVATMQKESSCTKSIDFLKRSAGHGIMGGGFQGIERFECTFLNTVENEEKDERSRRFPIYGKLQILVGSRNTKDERLSTKCHEGKRSCTYPPHQKKNSLIGPQI